jgi:hypothetical protein
LETLREAEAKSVAVAGAEEPKILTQRWRDLL